MSARFYVLAAGRHWVVVDREGEVLLVVRFRQKRQALAFAHELNGQEGATA